MIIVHTRVKMPRGLSGNIEWEDNPYEYFSSQQWIVFNRMHMPPLQRPPRPKIIQVAPSLRPSVITRQQWHIRRKLRAFTLQFAWDLSETRIWAYRLEMANL